jgi:hypothetical protein
MTHHSARPIRSIRSINRNATRRDMARAPLHAWHLQIRRSPMHVHKRLASNPFREADIRDLP